MSAPQKIDVVGRGIAVAADMPPAAPEPPTGPAVAAPPTCELFLTPGRARPGKPAGDGWLQAMKDSFDILYAEGARSPKMMSIGLHLRMIGRPGRISALDEEGRRNGVEEVAPNKGISTQRHKGPNKARPQRTATQVRNPVVFPGFSLSWLSFVVFVC